LHVMCAELACLLVLMDIWAGAKRMEACIDQLTFKSSNTLTHMHTHEPTHQAQSRAQRTHCFLQLSLHPEMEVLRQRVLGFEARGEEQASAGGTEPLSEDELHAAANASSHSVPVGADSLWGLVYVCSGLLIMTSLIRSTPYIQISLSTGTI